TAMWRADPDPDPENSLTGMLYEAFPADADLVVHDPDFFLLAGLGLRRGDRVAGLVATEIDRAYPIHGTPPNLQVVAHSPVPIAGRPPTHSDLTYYTSPSGAGVLSVGTMGWCTALRGPSQKHRIGSATVDFARTVTSRLFTAMAEGPLGTAHPARGNMAEIGASPYTSTGTGGPVARA
ncbi:MAG TPA: N,N-dimethylformamidase beta subunit family domain-containing protein, partial [Intrasporangium sp.]|nr:N,N-dimethylformamidase beta subunit family domain-containing protein [Intrasporangium sp.]